MSRTGSVTASGLRCTVLGLFLAASTSEAQRPPDTPPAPGPLLGVPAPQRMVALAGQRARLTAVDSAGTRFQLEGIVLQADNVRFEIRCLTTSLATSTCDHSAQTLFWRQVGEMHVLHGRASSALGITGRSARGMIIGGLMGAAIGVGSVALIDCTLSHCDDPRRESDIVIPRSFYGFAALGGGVLGVIKGGVVAGTGIRGVWVRFPLPDPL